MCVRVDIHVKLQQWTSCLWFPPCSTGYWNKDVLSTWGQCIVGLDLPTHSTLCSTWVCRSNNSLPVMVLEPELSSPTAAEITDGVSQRRECRVRQPRSTSTAENSARRRVAGPRKEWKGYANTRLQGQLVLACHPQSLMTISKWSWSGVSLSLIYPVWLIPNSNADMNNCLRLSQWLWACVFVWVLLYCNNIGRWPS